MKPYDLTHQDTCLPDYWGGHHLPVVQLVVDSTTTCQDIYNQLQGWDCYEHIDHVIDASFLAAVEVMFSTVKRPEGLAELFCPDLEPIPDEDDPEFNNYSDVYAFFTLDMHDTPEELEEEAANLEADLDAAISDVDSSAISHILAMMDEDKRLLPYDKLVEVQLSNYPNSKILTEAQVWMYIEHLPPESRAKKICLMTMKSAEQCKTVKVYYILNNRDGNMGVRYGVQGREYISGFSFGRGHDGE